MDAGDIEEINLHLKFTIMKSLKIFLFFSAIFGLLFYSCGKDCTDDQNPECPNYNPCKNLKETTAEFFVYDYPGNRVLPKTWEWADTDTVGMGAILEAKIYCVSGAFSYEWILDGTRYYGRKVEFKGGLPYNKKIDVTLIVRNKEFNKKCYPNDNGIDTFFRSFYTLPYLQESSMLKGIFRGVFEDNPFDSVDFVFHPDSNLVTFPSKECKNWFSCEYITANSCWLYVTSHLLPTPNPNPKCNFYSSAMFILDKKGVDFKLTFYNDTEPLKVYKKMFGRKIKQL